MFRCKECGSEFKEKPDYCDCGNDTFDEIIEKPAETPKPHEVPPQATKPQPVNIQKPQREEYNTSFNTRNEVPRVNNKADILSLGLFILSVGLAVCTIFVFGNPKEQPKQPEEQTQTVQDEKTANIPNVDSYWDNSTTGVTPDNVIPEENIIVTQNPLSEQQNTQPAEQPKATSDPMSKFEEWLNKPKRVVDDTPKYTTQTRQQTPQQTQVKQTTPAKQTTTQPKTQTKQQQPVSTANAKINSPGAPNDLLNRIQNNIQFTNTNTPKTTSTTKPSNSVAQATTSKPAQTATKPVQTTTSKPVQTTSKTTVTTQTPPTLRNATHQQVRSTAELQQEVASYKASLRNTIGKKINFANVIGDGNCTLTFKVDSSGKLINRNFATQSSNITLNDAVYKAMMSTPSYNPPPEGYKGETMTLRVKIYDGNYEITLN